jgi:hypothetical protein
VGYASKIHPGRPSFPGSGPFSYTMCGRA